MANTENMGELKAEEKQENNFLLICLLNHNKPLKLCLSRINMLEKINIGEPVYHPSFSDRRARRYQTREFRNYILRIQVPAWRQYDEEPTIPRENFRLTAEQERDLFLYYNFARQKYQKSRNGQSDYWLKQAQEAKEMLVGANMPLVLAMARRTNRGGIEIGELISEGNMALLRAVDKFDVSRGFNFSTYACQAILRCMFRASKQQFTHNSRYTQYDLELDPSDGEDEKHNIEEGIGTTDLRDVLLNNSAFLSDLERFVLASCFGLDSGKSRTLRQTGELVGLSNERIRQIRNEATEKLRKRLTGKCKDY